MKKVVSMALVLAMLFLMCSCEDIVRPATIEPKTDKTVETQPDTTCAQTVPPVTTEVSGTTSVSSDTTAPPSTTAIPGGWESVLYEEDGVQVIVGSSTLFGDPEDTTLPPVSADTYEPCETEEPEKEYYPTVLMYHCVHDEPYTENTALFVRPSELESHLQVLKELDIECLFADEFGPRNKNSVILTFDDGYEDNYTYMFPLIKKYNIKVTVYMIAYKIDMPGYLTAEQIKEMSDSGLVQFGSHTLDHPALTSLSEEAIREQFAGSSWLISKATGKPVTTLAYPSGRYNDTVMEIASEYYDFAYTTDDDYYFGQDDLMLPRYAILRGCTADGFRTFVD